MQHHHHHQHHHHQQQQQHDQHQTAQQSRSQQRLMTSTPVSQPSGGEFNGLNGLIRAALVEDPAIAIAAAAAAAVSSPQFQIPRSLGIGSHQYHHQMQMNRSQQAATQPAPPTAHQQQQQYRHPSALPATSTANLSIPTNTTPSWPDYMPVGRGLGYMGQPTASTSSYQPQQPPPQQHPARIPMPCTRSQLSLYRVLEHANLLEYFDTFIGLGGDDVQQLVEADEEEFLEIMSLVGMTQKPLHVRRLQKTLLKWRQDQRVFQLNGPLSARHAHYNKYQNSPVKYVLPFCQMPSEQDLDSGQDSSMDHSVTSQSTATPQCLAPREVLIGAPKRARLMDDFHRAQQAKTHEPPTDTEADESDLEVEQEQHGEN